MKVRFMKACGSAALLIGMTTTPPAFGLHEHEFHDTRYHLDRWYPARGTAVRALPDDRVIVTHGGDRFFYSGGIWYRPGRGGFVVVRPPYHVFVPVLPPFYTTVWIGGVPYYYANDVYYSWNPAQGEYEVVPPPDDNAATTQPPPSTLDVYAYPKKGQSDAQQAEDRYECHKWAVQQTGFDPTQNLSGMPPDQLADKQAAYQRAMSTCLEGRGYVVG